MKKYTSLFLSLILFASTVFAGGGTLKFEKPIHNFGTIIETEGNAEYVFRFTNTGRGPIRILQILTSCGCTTSDYTKTAVNPGESGYVKAIFDPKDRQGPFSRTLTVVTNGLPETYVLTVEGSVGSPNKELLAAFPYQIGSVRFSNKELVLPQMKEDKIDTIYLSVYNPSSKSLTIRNVITPYPVSGDVRNKIILPSGGDDLLFTFNGALCKGYGPRVDTLKLITNDETEHTKTFLIKSNIVQNFDKLTPQEKADAPVFVSDSTDGRIAELYQGEIGVYEFLVENKGKSDLLVKGYYSDCKCMTARFEKDKLKKGSKGKLIVTLNTKRMHRDVTRKITVITNDPKHSEQVFTIRTKVVIPGMEPTQN